MTFVTIVNSRLEYLIPLINEYKDNIRRHIIIYDIDEKKEAERLQKGIQKYSNAKIKLIFVDEDSKKDMLKLQDELKKESGMLYLNATNSDLSLITVVSGYILQNGGVVFAYDKKDNTYNKITKNSFENMTIKNNLTLKEFFTYRQIEFYSQPLDENYLNKKDEIFGLFEDSYLLFKDVEYIKNFEFKFLQKERKKIYKELKIIDNDRKIGSFGKLFEYFVYLKLKEFDFDDIWMNVELNFSNSTKNEFDIVAIKNNQIFLVECKFGSGFDGIDVVYKLDSLLENFAIDAKGLVVNLHPTKHEGAFLNRQFSEQLQKRAKENFIEIYSDYFFNEAIFDEKLSRFFGVQKKRYKSLKSEPIFLLGGRDLEMLEIKNLLIKHKKRFIDKELSWGAKLSQYRHLLNDQNYYYGIELIEDIEPPKNYVAIDHHNYNQTNKSSIEQVAEILGVELNRYLKLVSLNDKGYIKAMKEFKATEVEIEYIRKRDREAQGISEDDEKLAEISLQYGKMWGDIFVVEANTDKFVAILDRCYDRYENILIYNDKKLSYYGRDIEDLVKEYKQEIEKKKAYFGGEFGYFGLSEGMCKVRKELKRVVTILLRE